MISRKIVTDIQDGHIRTTEMELEAQMLFKMSDNKVIVVNSDEEPLFRMSLSAQGELQYESYDSLGEVYKTPVSMTPSSGRSMVSIYSVTAPTSGAVMTGFISQFSKGSEITFSLANQQLTLVPGDYQITAFSRFTATNQNGRLLFFPHNITSGTTTRLGSPTDLYQWDMRPITSTADVSNGNPQIFISVSTNPMTIDLRCDTLTSITTFNFIQVVVTKLN